MTKKERYPSDFDFISMVRTGNYPTPNEFTVEMGKLIRKARKEQGLSQAELSKLINRRPATISDIENGKSEISVISLATFAAILNKPVSYFFPPTILSDLILDINTPFERKALEIIDVFNHFADQEMVITLLEALAKYTEGKESKLTN